MVNFRKILDTGSILFKGKRVTAIFGSVNLVHITRARGSVIINIFPISHCSVFTLFPKSEIWISF